MTNNQIIYNESLDLVEKGILNFTSRIFRYTDEAGEQHEIKEKRTDPYICSLEGRRVYRQKR